jgi:hypothetical protein
VRAGSLVPYREVIDYMALTVKETKAGSRPAGGYSTSAPTLASHPLNLRTDSLVKPRPLVYRPRRIRRGSTAKATIGPMGLKARSIAA